eukprot:1895652-Pyramimonas_sp.AAC.1
MEFVRDNAVYPVGRPPFVRDESAIVFCAKKKALIALNPKRSIQTNILSEPLDGSPWIPLGPTESQSGPWTRLQLPPMNVMW